MSPTWCCVLCSTTLPLAGGGKSIRRQGDEDQALGVCYDVIEEKRALALLGAALAEGEKAAETAISGAGRWVSEQFRGVLQIEPRADEKFDTHLLGGKMGAYHTGKRVRVSDGDGFMAECLCGRHQFFRVRAAT